MTDTRERILAKALDLFSTYGYEGTNLRDLAAQIGLSKSALYRHFTSKEDIWNALMDEIENAFEVQYRSFLDEHAQLTFLPTLSSQTMRAIKDIIHNQKMMKMKRLITISQFQDVKAARIASLYFHYRMLEFYQLLFQEMMDHGLLERDDAASLAMEFVTPIAAWMGEIGRSPKKEKEILGEIEAFINRFIDRQTW